MIFNIEWKERAIQNLSKIEKFIAKRIYSKIEELQEDPFSKDIKRLQGETTFRLRIGDYRAIFEIEKNKIIILKVGHRKNIYKK